MKYEVMFCLTIYVKQTLEDVKFISLRYLHYAMTIVHVPAVADFQLEPYGSGLSS